MAERCRGWDSDAAWHGTVPLGLYAQAVHGVCGFVLSEDELCQLLCAVHPEQGEPPSGKLPCGNQPPRSFGQFARSSSGRPPASGSLRQPRPASANWQMCSGWPATPALFSTSILLPLLSTIQWRMGKYAPDATACCARPSGNWCFSMSIAARAFDPASVTLKRTSGAVTANTWFVRAGGAWRWRSAVWLKPTERARMMCGMRTVVMRARIIQLWWACAVAVALLRSFEVRQIPQAEKVSKKKSKLYATARAERYQGPWSSRRQADHRPPLP